MKFIKNILWVLFASLMVSCGIEDYKIEYTAIAPMGGQYRIISLTDETGADVKASVSSGNRYVYISNTVLDEADKCWVRIGGYSTASSNFYGINGKVSCNVSNKQNMTFSGSNVENLAGNVAHSSATFTVEGVVVENAAKCPSGEITESITMTFTNSNFPGKTYKVTGWKYTGWPEDL